MAGFTEAAFVKKLTDLNNSSQSIQTLSLWLIHHRKHYATVVKLWLRELLKGNIIHHILIGIKICLFLVKGPKKLTFMYLANDVIQNSRKKGPEYGQEFGTHLARAFDHMSDSETKTVNSLERLLTIWSERGIYNEIQITEFRGALSTLFSFIFILIDSFILEKEGPPSKKAKMNNVKASKERKKIEQHEVVIEVRILEYFFTIIKIRNSYFR